MLLLLGRNLHLISPHHDAASHIPSPKLTTYRFFLTTTKEKHMTQ